MLTIFDSIRKEFSVNDKGESFCSRRAIARMTGQELKTIRGLLQSISLGKQRNHLFESFLKIDFSESECIPDILVSAIIVYYACKGNQTAQETLQSLTLRDKQQNIKKRKIFTSQDKVKKGSFVYLIKNLTTGNLKIGYSTNPYRRLIDLQQSTDCELKLLAFFESTVDEEQAILGKYYQYNIRGEWFKPATEIYLEFGLVDELTNASRNNINSIYSLN